jgi:hypothetical protein
MVTAHRISEQGSTEFGIEFKDFKSAYDYIRAIRHSGTFIVTEKSGEQTIVANRGGGNMYQIAVAVIYI